jgi:hypothetical protein
MAPTALIATAAAAVMVMVLALEKLRRRPQVCQLAVAAEWNPQML